jgi:hypothetical protein
MEAVATIGLDIAKSVFQVHGVDAGGAVVVQRRLTRARMLPFGALRWLRARWFRRTSPTKITVCATALDSAERTF